MNSADGYQKHQQRKVQGCCYHNDKEEEYEISEFDEAWDHAALDASAQHPLVLQKDTSSQDLDKNQYKSEDIHEFQPESDYDENDFLDPVNEFLQESKNPDNFQGRADSVHCNDDVNGNDHDDEEENEEEDKLLESLMATGAFEIIDPHIDPEKSKTKKINPLLESFKQRAVLFELSKHQQNSEKGNIILDGRAKFPTDLHKENEMLENSEKICKLRNLPRHAGTMVSKLKQIGIALSKQQTGYDFLRQESSKVIIDLMEANPRPEFLQALPKKFSVFGCVIEKFAPRKAPNGRWYTVCYICNMKRKSMTSMAVAAFDELQTDMPIVSQGDVIEIECPSFLKPFGRDSGKGLAIHVKSTSKILRVGQSQDFNVCREKMLNGSECGRFVHLRVGTKCEKHTATYFQKALSSKRPELNNFERPVPQMYCKDKNTYPGTRASQGYFYAGGTIINVDSESKYADRKQRLSEPTRKLSQDSALLRKSQEAYRGKGASLYLMAMKQKEEKEQRLIERQKERDGGKIRHGANLSESCTQKRYNEKQNINNQQHEAICRVSYNLANVHNDSHDTKVAVGKRRSMGSRGHLMVKKLRGPAIIGHGDNRAANLMNSDLRGRYRDRDLKYPSKNSKGILSSKTQETYDDAPLVDRDVFDAQAEDTEIIFFND